MKEIAPTIHLNGTPPEALLEAYTKASEALDAACYALKETAPNGRDYYPQGMDAIHLATEKHYCRLFRLTLIKQEIDALAEAVYAQMTESNLERK